MSENKNEEIAFDSTLVRVPAAAKIEEFVLLILYDLKLIGGVSNLPKVREYFLSVFAKISFFDYAHDLFLAVVNCVKHFVLYFLLQINTNTLKCYFKAFTLTFDFEFIYSELAPCLYFRIIFDNWNTLLDWLFRHSSA